MYVFFFSRIMHFVPTSHTVCDPVIVMQPFEGSNPHVILPVFTSLASKSHSEVQLVNHTWQRKLVWPSWCNAARCHLQADGLLRIGCLEQSGQVIYNYHWQTPSSWHSYSCKSPCLHITQCT